MKPVSDHIWVQSIAEQLLAILPKSKKHSSFLDISSVPAFFYASRLLERLGYAEILNGTVRILKQPNGVQLETRWDDAYHIFLLCLEERQLINYEPIGRETVVAMAESYYVGADDLAAEINDTDRIKITASAHTADATVHPCILTTLERIGLVASSHWTGPAIPVLWRKWANHNRIERPADTQLFQDRVNVHFTYRSAEVTNKLEELLSFTDDLLDRQRMMLGGENDEEEIRRLAAQSRMMDLQFLLAERWRFSDGWLSANQMSKCLFVGFDGLAAELAHTLVTKKFPDSDVGRGLQHAPDARPYLN